MDCKLQMHTGSMNHFLEAESFWLAQAENFLRRAIIPGASSRSQTLQMELARMQISSAIVTLVEPG